MSLGHNELTHCRLVTPYDNTDLGQYCISWSNVDLSWVQSLDNSSEGVLIRKHLKVPIGKTRLTTAFLESRDKVHLHYIRDLGPSIRVRAQSKYLNWCFVFTLIRVRVRDFCLGRPCPSSSLHVAISSDMDVRVRPRLCNAHAQSCRFMWSLLQATKNLHCLGWTRIRASDVV